MGTTNITESIVRSKAVGIFLALWGLSFVLGGIADPIDFFTVGWGTSSSTILWLTRDIVLVIAGIALWVVAAKILTAKK